MVSQRMLLDRTPLTPPWNSITLNQGCVDMILQVPSKRRKSRKNLIPQQLHPRTQLVGVGSSVFGGGHGPVTQGERSQARNTLEARSIACKLVP